MEVSKRTKEISPSLTLEISAKAKKMKAEGISVIGFTAGEPDCNTPDYIIESAKRALDEGFTKYTPASGTQELKQAICNKLSRDNGLSYTTDQILISTGAKSSLFHIISAMVEEGDEVIIPSPYWLTYPELVKLAGGKCVYVETKKENGYKITAKELESAITEKSKCIILNSPNNPTGAVYTEEELRALSEVIINNDLLVISDEIYEKLIYDGEKFYSIAQVSEQMKNRTVVVNGLSKAYSMTGWRVGYLAGPKEIVKAASSMQSHTTSNTCSISQYASVEALNSPKSEEFISQMVTAFDRRRKLIMEKMSEIEGVEFSAPKGAFYLFLDVSSYYGKSFNGEVINGSLKFCDLALAKGVALIPGVAFGEDKCVRLSYAIADEDIIEGAKRIKSFISELK